MKKNKIAQVIPLTRLKRSLHSFDYNIPNELQQRVKKGQLLEIPFRNKVIKGVIFNLNENYEKRKFKLKEIKAIIEPQPFLFLWQIKLIERLSRYYFVSMSVLAKMVIPDIPKRASKKKVDFMNNVEFIKPIKNNIKIENFIRSKKPILLRYYNEQNKIVAYLALIKKIINRNEQVVIIVPQLNDIKRILPYLIEFKDIISIFLNDLTKNNYWEEWVKIKKGQAQIIIGTRSAIFAPFKNLNTIIIDQEENENHKQEEPNPRYNVKNVALEIRNLLKCKILFVSNTPSLNSLYQVQQKNWQYCELDKKIGNVNVKIINRQDEFKKGNFSILSDYLQEKIEYCIKRAQKVFLFINRKGLATLLSCKDCGFVAQCPTCKLPLTLYKDKILKCHHCNYQQNLFLFCPECKGPNIKMQGTGTEKVETEIRKSLPLVKILRIDIDTPPSTEDIMENDIIIGTQYAFSYIDWNKIDMIGVINADTLLYLPDYKSMEKTFNLLMKLARFLEKKNELIIQTFTPENYIFQAVSNFDYKKYYIQEIKERKSFYYPPISKLVRLIYQSIEFNAGQNEIKSLYNKLKSDVGVDSNIVINPPVLAYTQQVRGRWRWQIVIKIKDQNNDLNFLQDIPENIIIDIDPVSLL